MVMLVGKIASKPRFSRTVKILLKVNMVKDLDLVGEGDLGSMIVLLTTRAVTKVDVVVEVEERVGVAQGPVAAGGTTRQQSQCQRTTTGDLKMTDKDRELEAKVLTNLRCVSTCLCHAMV
jgi:hypothetical protein